MGEKHRRLPQDPELLHPGLCPDIGGQSAQRCRPLRAAHRQQHIPRPVPQALRAGPVKAGIPVHNRTEGDVHQRPLPPLRPGRQLREGRPHKGHPLPEVLAAGLEGPGGIDNGIGLAVILNQVGELFHLVPVLPQQGQPLPDLGQARQGVEYLQRAGAHRPGGLLVKGEGGGGAHQRQPQPPGVQLAPDADGIGYHAVRPEFAQLPERLLLHGHRHIDHHRHEAGEVVPHPPPQIPRGGGQEGVAGDELGSRALQLRPEFLKGVVAHPVPPAHQLPHHLHRGIGVSVGGNGEKDDPAHITHPISY